LLQKCFLDIAV